MDWSGQLGDIIAAYADVDDDLLCPGLRKTGWGWSWHNEERDKLALPDKSKLAHCETALMRISRRLLLRLAADEWYRGLGIFCEMRLPTLCKRHSSWCKMRDVTRVRPHLFGQPFSSSRDANASFVASHTSTLLFHRVKQ